MPGNITNYPPYIEGKIDAQCGDTIKIPYQLNRAIGIGEITEMYARIKLITTNDSIGQPIQTTKFSTQQSKGIYLAQFYIEDPEVNKALQVGQYYKIQLAFNNPQSTYSTVGIFKYTKRPEITILDLDKNIVNSNLVTYVGQYQQPANNGDTTEKVYEYKFDLYYQGQIKESSDWLLHTANANEDPNRSTDQYFIRTDLKEGEYYQLFYTVKTNNGLTISSPGYYITKEEEIKDDKFTYDFTLIAKNNRDEGYISIFAQPQEEDTIYGKYKLYRKKEGDERWEEIESLILDTQYEKNNEEKQLLLLYKDKTVEQGIAYQYAISRYSKDLFVYKLIANDGEAIICDFEDAFLYDGERQLKIRFNPKISSFKNTLLEQKTDTIGGKYPFIFRNGRTCYKEFPISGLISLLMDDNYEFVSNQNLNQKARDKTLTNQEISMDLPNNLSCLNMANEREFKIEVLNWLTNGEPKLFKSPAEGNYIVRLMNTSLSPEDKLSRMLHTFSTTAYEIAELNYDNLISFGFTGHINDLTSNLHSETIVLSEYQDITTISLRNIAKLTILNAEEGAPFELVYSDGDKFNFEIGLSGFYELDSTNLMSSITFNPMYGGTLLIYSEGKEDYEIELNTNESGQSAYSLVKIETCEFISQIIGNGTTINLLEGLSEEEFTEEGVYSVINEITAIKYLRVKTKDLLFRNEINNSKLKERSIIIEDLNSYNDDSFILQNSDKEPIVILNKPMFIKKQPSIIESKEIIDNELTDQLTVGKGIIVDICYQVKRYKSIKR